MFYTQSGVRILYLVRILYPVRSPWSAVRSPCFILTQTHLSVASEGRSEVRREVEVVEVSLVMRVTPKDNRVYSV